MQYFAHTLKACGPLALALVLSACGEETNIADAELSQSGADSIEEQNLQALGESQGAGPSQTIVNRQYSPPQPGASDQNAGGEQNPRFLIAEPNFQIDRPTTANLDKTELASNDTVIEATTPNARADQNTPVTGRPEQTGGDTLPVEPPKQLPPEIAPVGGDPLVSLVAKTENGATQLEWNTENVDTCETSGGWEGNVGTTGIANLSHEASGEHTYMINCSGAQGTAMAMVTVTVESTSLAWERPSRNADGSALNDLAGYNMYYGTESGRYTQVKSVPDAGKTELDLPVEPGTYYLAVTAYDRTGNESELSNEIVRIVN